MIHLIDSLKWITEFLSEFFSVFFSDSFETVKWNYLETLVNVILIKFRRRYHITFLIKTEIQSENNIFIEMTKQCSKNGDSVESF